MPVWNLISIFEKIVIMYGHVITYGHACSSYYTGIIITGSHLYDNKLTNLNLLSGAHEKINVGTNFFSWAPVIIGRL